MIVLCEPQCRGFVHEEANAGVVNEIINEHKEEIVFFGDRNHYTNILRILSSRVGLKFKLPLKRLNIPTRIAKKYGVNRLNDYFNIRKVLAYCIKNDVRNIIFLSVNGYQLKLLNKELRRLSDIGIYIILHGILEELEWDSESLFKTEYINHNEKINFVYLSKHIKRNLEKIGYLTSDSISIDHPYVWNSRINKEISDNPVLKLCLIGYIHEEKGSDYVKRLIKNLVNNSIDFKLHILGFLDIDLDIDINDRRVKIFNRRFDREELDDLIPKYDFILAPYKFDGYSLKVSGVFFDAINYMTPIITFKNDFTEYYFNKLGAIGYIFNNEKAMDDFLIKFIRCKNVDILKTLVNNMVLAQRKLESKII